MYVIGKRVAGGVLLVGTLNHRRGMRWRALRQPVAQLDVMRPALEQPIRRGAAPPPVGPVQPRSA